MWIDENTSTMQALKNKSINTLTWKYKLYIKAVLSTSFLSWESCIGNTTYQMLLLLQTRWLDPKCLYTVFTLDTAWNFIIHLHSLHHGYPSKYFSPFPTQSWLAVLSEGISLAAIISLLPKILCTAASDTTAHALSLPHLFPDVLDLPCLYFA